MRERTVGVSAVFETRLNDRVRGRAHSEANARARYDEELSRSDAVSERKRAPMPLLEFEREPHAAIALNAAISHDREAESVVMMRAVLVAPSGRREERLDA
jgi:hypothetical protein